MPRTNPKNDRVKREYLVYLKDARQRSATTVDQVRHAIDRLEVYTGFKDFGTFNKEQALGFKRAPVANKGQRSRQANQYCDGISRPAGAKGISDRLISQDFPVAPDVEIKRSSGCQETDFRCC